MDSVASTKSLVGAMKLMRVMSESPSELDIDDLLTLPAVGCTLPYSDIDDAVKRVKVLYDNTSDANRKKKLAAAHNHL
jgi:hypothetical protein